MPDFPIGLGAGRTLTPAHAATQLLVSGSTHTKTAWVEFITSTSIDADGVWVSAMNGNSPNHSYLLDVAIGAAGSEIVIASNVLIAQLQNVPISIFLPFEIPAGSRISARAQGTNVPTAVWPRFTLSAGGMLATPPGGRLLTFGAVTATTRGTALTGNNGSFGSWAELTASTTADVVALWVLVGNNGNSAPVVGNITELLVDVGVGAAGSEVSVLGPIPIVTTTAGIMLHAISTWFPCSIPAGSRIAARYWSNNTDATDRKVDVVAYGLSI